MTRTTGCDSDQDATAARRLYVSIASGGKDHNDPTKDGRSPPIILHKIQSWENSSHHQKSLRLPLYTHQKTCRLPSPVSFQFLLPPDCLDVVLVLPRPFNVLSLFVSLLLVGFAWGPGFGLTGRSCPKLGGYEAERLLRRSFSSQTPPASLFLGDFLQLVHPRLQIFLLFILAVAVDAAQYLFPELRLEVGSLLCSA